MIFTNIRGTSEPYFRISLSGPTIYQGTTDPAVSPPTSLDGLPLKPGDVYIRTDAANPGIFTKDAGVVDTDWSEILVAGGPIVVGGNLSVGGVIDQSGPIITLNSGLSAIPGTGSGVEVARNGVDNVFWIWDDVNLYWKPSSATPTPTLHNVSIGNNLVVGSENSNGRLIVPNGIAVTPGIRFSSAGTGLYSSGTSIGFSISGAPAWLIDSSGNLMPVASNDIGTTGSLAGNIYGTRFIGADGTNSLPAFSFDSESNTGMYLGGISILGLSVNGAKILELTPSNATVTGILNITNTSPSTWSLTNDSGDLDKLKLINSGGSGSIDITTSGYVLASNGGIGLGTPAYSFISNENLGMYTDGGNLRFTLDSVSDHLIITPTYIRAPSANVVSDPQDLTTKLYVDAITGGSWRQPVIVKEDITYVDIVAAEAALNTFGNVDGVSMNSGDRVLYTALISGNKNIFTISGSLPNFVLTEDGGVTVGDTVYVDNGTSGGKIFSYDVTNFWAGVSGTGGGGTMYFDYEVQVAIALQTTFVLTTSKYAPTVDGSRLQIYVNGVKQVFGVLNSYTETNETTVEFSVSPGVGKVVEFYATGLATNKGILIRETQTGLVSTPVITFNSITYVPSQDGLLVYHNGQKMVLGIGYSEINNNSIQWISPALISGDVLEFYSSAPIIAGVNLEDLGNVSGSPADKYEIRYNAGFAAWEPIASGTSQTGLLYDDESTVSGVIDGVNSLFTTLNSSVAPDLGGRSFQQVFVNGVLQREGVGGDYVATSSNTITFNAGSIPTLGDTMDIYQL